MTEAERLADLERQIDRLADFILEHIPGEPSQSQGAIQTAIRLLTNWMEKRTGHGCLLAAPNRGDCHHFIGLPGRSIPGQHDGPDDTMDVYGRPNGWCQVCWDEIKITRTAEAAYILFGAMMTGTKK